MGRGIGCPGAKKGWFELSPGQDVNYLHTFSIEKKAQRKKNVNLNIILSQICFKSPKLFLPNKDLLPECLFPC